MKIVTVPNKGLTKVCDSVIFTGDGAWSKGTLGRLFIGLLDAMYANDGIGLAAPQVGVQARVIVVDTAGERHQALKMVNPEIWWKSAAMEVGPEGCLSVPGEFGMVSRHARIKVHYQNQDGLLEDLEADGLLARVIQHEVDHLSGILFTSKLSPESPAA